MSAAAIRAGRAYVELGANDSKLQAGLRSAQNRLQKWAGTVGKIGAVLSGAGAALTTPLSMMAFGAAKHGDELAKMADRTGASVEALSELKHAAGQSDVSFDQLGKAIQKMQKNLVDTPDEFRALGLSVEELMALTPDQQFEMIAERISQMQDPAQRTAAAMALLGKSGADLMPLMLGGASGIRELRDEARDLGLQVSTEDAQAAVEFSDAWSRVMSVVKDVRNEIGLALLPRLTELFDYVTPTIVTIARWIAENRMLIVTIASVAVGILAAGTATLGLAAALKMLAIGLGLVNGMLTITVGLVTFLGSPVGLLIAAIIGLGAAIVYFTDLADPALEWLSEGFTELLADATRMVKAIGGALARGDITAAADVLWAGLKAAWLTGTHELTSIWIGFKHGMVSVWFTVEKSVRQGITNIVAAWKQAQAWLEKTQKKAAEGFWSGWAKGNANKEYIKKLDDIAARESSGALTPQQAERQRHYAKMEYDDKIRYSDQSAGVATKQADEDYAAQRDEINAELNRQLSEIERENDALQVANTAEYINAIAAAKQQMDAATAAYTDVRDQVENENEKERKRRERDAETSEDEEEAPGISSLASLSGAQRTGASFGTFSAAQALQNYGAGNLQQQMATHLATIATNTTAMKNNGPPKVTS